MRTAGRRVLVAVAVVGACACALAGPASAQSIEASCDTPAGRDACNRWYTSASVFLDWTLSAAPTSVSGCVSGVFTAEARVERSCQADWTGTSITKNVWIGIDRTPPRLVGIAASRPADYNGWFNHPVALTFRAVDQTSGVASCSSRSYSGPDGLGVRVGGRCTDVAGNSGSAAFPLNYDATPPARPSLETTPGNKRVTIRWAPQPLTEAVLVRLRKRSAPKLLYRGPDARFTQRRLHNGRRYRYRLTLIDQAGNSAAVRTSAVPTASPLLRPANGAHVHGAPLLLWKRARRASYYNAQLVRARTKVKVLSSWPTRPRLQLQRRWHFEHHVRRLISGRYCWYVWPGRGARSEHRYGRLLGKSCFVEVR